MFLFGPATVTLNGSYLGDTYGGVSVSFDMINPNTLGAEELICTGGNGKIRLYNYSELTLGSDAKVGSGELIFNGASYKLTFYNAYLFMGESLEFGTMSQEPITLTFRFRENSSGNIVNME